jgi:hypothetical protein
MVQRRYIIMHLRRQGFGTGFLVSSIVVDEFVF